MPYAVQITAANRAVETIHRLQSGLGNPALHDGPDRKAVQLQLAFDAELAHDIEAAVRKTPTPRS